MVARVELSSEKKRELLRKFDSGDFHYVKINADKLLKKYPNSVFLLNLSGVVRKKLGYFEDAIRIYLRLIKIAPKFSEGFYNLGVAYKDQGSFAEAVDMFNKAIQIKDDYSDAYNNKGTVLSVLGDKRGALECFDSAIRYKNTPCEALYNASSLLDFKNDSKYLSLMEELLEKSSVQGWDRIYLLYALFKAYDDSNNFEKAFALLEEGSKLRRGMSQYHIGTDRLDFKLIKSIEYSVASAGNFKKNIFVVGMPRSGTSLVEQILSSHSDVYGAGELSYVYRSVMPIIEEVVNRGVNNKNIALPDGWNDKVSVEYNRLLRVNRIYGDVIVDKMPTNFMMLGFILSSFSNVKIINVRRNPVATCWSNYRHLFSVAGNEYSYGQTDLAEFYFLYDDLMQYWHDLYPGMIYDVQYERLTEDQENQTRMMLEYCGLSWEDSCLEFHKNNRPVNTASALQVRKKMYKGSSEVWFKYEKYIHPLLDGLNKYGLIDENKKSTKENNEISISKMDNIEKNVSEDTIEQDVISIDDQEYKLCDLPGSARSLLTNVQIVDHQIINIQRQLVIMQTARNVYINALKNEIAR